MAKKLSVTQLRSMDLGALTDRQLRQAYTTYRDVLHKRFERLSGGTATQQAYAAPFRAGGSKELKTLAEISKLLRKGWTEEQLRREMLHRVKELQIIEQGERSSLTGWKKIEQRTVKALQDRGYKNINKGNLKVFGEYMERMRSVFGNKIFPSEEVAEAFDNAIGEAADLDPNELYDLIINEMGDSFGVDLFA